MNVVESTEAFTKYSRVVFTHPRLLSIRGPIFANRSKYSTKILNAAIKECVKEKEPDSTRPWKQDVFASPEDPCKT